MARSFTSTDRVASGLVAAASTHTFLLWFRAPNTSATRYLWRHGANTNSAYLDTNGDLVVSRIFSTTSGVWTVASADIDTAIGGSGNRSDWVCLSVTYDAGSTANDPTVRIGTETLGFSAVSVTRTTAPVGTPFTDAFALAFGNLTSGGAPLEGDLGPVAFHSAVLSDAAQDAWRLDHNPVQSSCSLSYEMDNNNPAPDISGNGLNGSITGTTYTSDDPVPVGPAQTVAPGFIASTAQVFTPTLVNGPAPQTITAPHIASTAQVFAPAVLSAPPDPAITYPTHPAHPRPAEETILLRAEGGQWTHVGTDAARGIWHEGLSLTADRAGPSSCSFTLRRDPRLSWPDLSPFNECIVEVGGVRVWSGRMREAPGQSGASNSIAFTGSGWQSHLDDDLMAYGWLHSRLAEWRPMGDGSVPGTYPTGMVGSVEAGRMSVGWQRDTTMRANTRAGMRLDLGEHHPGVRRIIIDCMFGAVNAWSTIFARGYAQTGLTGAAYDAIAGYGSSGFTAGVWQFLTGTFAQPVRSVVLFLQRGGTDQSTAAAEHILTVRQLMLFTDTADESGNASNLKASTVIGDVVASGRLPHLSTDTSRIETTSFNIPDYWPTGHQSPRELMEPVNAFHDYDLGVDVDRRVYFRAPAERATLEVGQWSGAEFSDASAGSGEDVFNKVIVQASDVTGTAVDVIRTAATAAPELAAAVAVPSAVANPSVETNTTGWTLSNVSRVNTGGGANGGSWALKTTASTTGSASIAVTGLSPGIPHRLRVWLRTIIESGTGLVTPVGTLSIGGAAPLAVSAVTGAPVAVPSAAAGWVERVVGFVPTEATGTLRFDLTVGGTVLYIDELSVERVEVNTVDRHRFARAQRLPISAPLTVAAAEVLGGVWLRNHIRTPLKGSVTVTAQGGVREAQGGAPIHPAHLLLRTGEVMRHAGMADPDTGAWGRNGRIASVSYSAGQATVELDNERHRLEALIARYAALAGQVG